MKLLKLMFLSALFFPMMGSSEKQTLQDQIKEQNFLFQVIIKSISKSKEMTDKENEIFGKWFKSELAKFTAEITYAEIARMLERGLNRNQMMKEIGDGMLMSGLGNVRGRIIELQDRLKEIS